MDIANAEFTRNKLATKVKQLRQNYRKAIDSGRKSGGGRIVATFFDLWGNICGGSYVRAIYSPDALWKTMICIKPGC